MRILTTFHLQHLSTETWRWASVCMCVVCGVRSHSLWSSLKMLLHKMQNETFIPRLTYLTELTFLNSSCITVYFIILYREESDTTERLHFHFSLSCFGEGNGNPLQCSCLENPRDGGAWWAAIYGVIQSWTRLKRFSSSSSSSSSMGFSSGSAVKNPPAIKNWSMVGEDPLKKEMTTHSSVLAWEIPQTKEPSRLQSMKSQRVRHDLATEHKRAHNLHTSSSFPF